MNVRRTIDPLAYIWLWQLKCFSIKISRIFDHQRKRHEGVSQHYRVPFDTCTASDLKQSTNKLLQYTHTHAQFIHNKEEFYSTLLSYVFIHHPLWFKSKELEKIESDIAALNYIITQFNGAVRLIASKWWPYSPIANAHNWPMCKWGWKNTQQNRFPLDFLLCGCFQFCFQYTIYRFLEQNCCFTFLDFLSDQAWVHLDLGSRYP